MSNKPKNYHVIVDGYACTGSFSSAQDLGVYTASSPREACRKALEANGYDMHYWDGLRYTWWGCKVTAELTKE